MLLIVKDSALDGIIADWAVATIFEGVARAATGAVLATDSTETDKANQASRPVVLMLNSNEAKIELEVAAASSAAVIWVTHKVSPGVRNKLRIEGIGRAAIPVTVVTLSDNAPESDPIGAVTRIAVSPVETKQTNRKLRKLGAAHAGAAARPRKLDQLDAETHRMSSAQAARRRLDELLAMDNVEELQIRGSEWTHILRPDGSVDTADSPFDNDDEIIEATRHLASFGGGQPQRFDRLQSRLDTQIGTRWRLHAEAYMCNPPTMVLRSNMGSTVELEELNLAEPRLLRILDEAISGTVRANAVVAAQMGGGKTTLVQALLKKVPETERVDTIEDTPELRLASYGIHQNSYERLTKDANTDGVGKVTMTDHIRDAKRSNSSKLVIGETRGEGTLDALDAMTSGLTGCLVTLHSPPGKGVMGKLTAYACAEGAEPRFARAQIGLAVQLLIWLGRNRDGQRVIADVTQIIDYDEAADIVTTKPLWLLHTGDKWARPVAEPEGAVAAVYRSAGVDVSGDLTTPHAIKHGVA